MGNKGFLNQWIEHHVVTRITRSGLIAPDKCRTTSSCGGLSKYTIRCSSIGWRQKWTICDKSNGGFSMRVSRHTRMPLGSAVLVAVSLTSRVVAGGTPETGPKFADHELPEPPQQHSRWSAPPTQLPTNLVSSV